MIRKNNLGEIANQNRRNCKPKSAKLKNNFAQIGKLTFATIKVDVVL